MNMGGMRNVFVIENCMLEIILSISQSVLWPSSLTFFFFFGPILSCIVHQVHNNITLEIFLFRNETDIESFLIRGMRGAKVRG